MVPAIFASWSAVRGLRQLASHRPVEGSASCLPPTVRFTSALVPPSWGGRPAGGNGLPPGPRCRTSCSWAFFIHPQRSVLQVCVPKNQKPAPGPASPSPASRSERARTQEMPASADHGRPGALTQGLALLVLGVTLMAASAGAQRWAFSEAAGGACCMHTPCGGQLITRSCLHVLPVCCVASEKRCPVPPCMALHSAASATRHRSLRAWGTGEWLLPGWR